MESSGIQKTFCKQCGLECSISASSGTSATGHHPVSSCCKADFTSLIVEPHVHVLPEYADLGFRWISVEDALPPDYYGEVMFMDDTPKYIVWLSRDSREPQKARYWHGQWYIDGYLGDFPVSHWMEVTPPEGK